MGLKPQELILSLFWKPKYKVMVSVGIALCSEEIYFMPFLLLWGVSENPGLFLAGKYADVGLSLCNTFSSGSSYLMHLIRTYVVGVRF